MARRLTAALLGVALLASSAAAEQLRLPGIFGRDDRTPTESMEWPWSAIGRVNGVGGHFCTGTLIGPSTVLTAAHCLYAPGEGGFAAASDIDFVAGYSLGRFEGRSVGQSIETPPGWEPDGGADQIGLDWAILRLASPIEIEPVPLLALDANALTHIGPLLRAGYSQDRPYMLGRQDHCAVIGVVRHGAVLLHSCDATYGDSGSPLMVRRGDDIAIVGVHVAVVGSGRASFGAAVPTATFAEIAGQ